MAAMAGLLAALVGAASTAAAAQASAAVVAPSMYANLITTRMGGLSPEEIALLMSMLDDNGDGEITCALPAGKSGSPAFSEPPTGRQLQLDTPEATRLVPQSCTHAHTRACAAN